MKSIAEAHKYLGENVLPFLLPLDVDEPEGARKVIHDHLWGSHSFYQWEIALIDTPLLQRLRQIHQLGTAWYTYPSAVHTRFSHTLGVTVLANQLITNLREKLRDGTIPLDSDDEADSIISQKEIYTVRLSAILHDIGHCFFSHCTEILADDILEGIKEEIKAKYTYFTSGSIAKNHEIIAYLIITSPYFQQFWDKNILVFFNKYGKGELPAPEDIALPIIGVVKKPQKTFITDIINGTYDVDKLEYLHRDAKSAGLAITYDSDRFFQKITLFNTSQNPNEPIWKLAMGLTGIRTVEQIILNKMLLAPFVYHHQKVLVMDNMVRDIAMFILRGEKHKFIKAQNYFDLLLYSDNDLLAMSSSFTDCYYNSLLNKLKFRHPPKRCFVLHKDFLIPQADKDLTEEQIEHSVAISLSKTREAIFENLTSVRQEIIILLNDKLSSMKDTKFKDYDIIISNTSFKSNISSVKNALVVTHNNTQDIIEKHWVMGNWDATYSAKKEYIYFYIDEKYKNQAFEVIKDYLTDKYNLSLNLEKIREATKLI